MPLSRFLATAALAAILIGGAATAQQQPNNQNRDANGPITILKNMANEPDGVVVRVNGTEVDRFHTIGYDDITSVVRAGMNSVTVAWANPIRELNFKIAYAPTRNNFRNVLVIRIDANQNAALRRSGSRTFPFAIPR